MTWRFQFRLLTVFVITSIVAVHFGWEVRVVNRRIEMIQWVEDHGGGMVFMDRREAGRRIGPLHLLLAPLENGHPIC